MPVERLSSICRALVERPSSANRALDEPLSCACQAHAGKLPESNAYRGENCIFRPMLYASWSGLSSTNANIAHAWYFVECLASVEPLSKSCPVPVEPLSSACQVPVELPSNACRLFVESPTSHRSSACRAPVEPLVEPHLCIRSKRLPLRYARCLHVCIDACMYVFFQAVSV